MHLTILERETRNGVLTKLGGRARQIDRRAMKALRRLADAYELAVKRL